MTAGKVLELFDEARPEVFTIPSPVGDVVHEEFHAFIGLHAPIVGGVLRAGEDADEAFDAVHELVLDVFALECAGEFVVFDEFDEP